MYFRDNNKYFFFFKIIFVVILTAYLFNTNFFDLNKIFEYHIDLKILFIIFILISVTIVVAALRWALLLKIINFKIKFIKLLEITYISCFFNSILIGGLGGEFFRVYYIYNSSKDNNLKLSTTVLVDRIIGFLGLLLIIFYFIKSIAPDEFIIFINKIFFIFLFALILFIFFFCILKKNFFNKKFFNVELFIFIKKIFLKLIFAIILSVLIFIIINYCIYLIGINIYKFNLNLDHVFLSFSISIIFNTLSFTPGGIGVGEVVFAKILEYLNNQNLIGIASIYVFWRIVYLIFCLPAIFLFFLYKKKIYSFKKN